MPEALSVAIDRARSPVVDPDESVVEVGSTFDIVLRNRDQPIHVHVHLEGDLARVASVDAANHYLDTDGVRTVTVRVRDGPRPVEGRLKIVAAYGDETAYVTVRVVDPATHDPPVVVDESLAEPQVETDDELDLRTATAAGVAALAATAVALAVASVVFFDALAVRAAVVVVILTVVAALYLLAS
jgi:hypothetical protein